ncbi:hypothetical protein [Psychroserpens sp.]|uniref:hypothetical protein n=1 Tax=Psychroserpens sp. TaxID=2020870 RepID=UPI00385DE4FF
MKLSIKIIFTLTMCFSVFFTSCRKEETEFIDSTTDEIIEPESSIANLMLRTASNDGSDDNIIDVANCFNIKLPITVTANAIQVDVNSKSDYVLIESIFDEEYDDINNLEISYPVTVVKNDFTEIVVNSSSELTAIAAECNGENIEDDDIECLDFTFPITASIFNISNESLSNEVLTTDKELYTFVNTIATEEIVSINFPITVKLLDDTIIEIHSIPELRSTINAYQNTCDEDDDFDFDDDDCNDCTQELVADFLTNCQDWYVDKLKRESTDYNSVYEGYDFNFFTDGSLSVFWNTTTVFGTWSMLGTGNNITIIIDVPALPLCNNNWELQEISNTTGIAKVDFVLSTSERLRYRNSCN